MNSPAPNIPGAVSAMSPFTEYIMNELELEATSEDDIRAGDETLDAIFAEDHALGVGGGAASSAGRTPAGDLATARAMAALSFVDIDQKPPADEGKHAPLKKTPCQSIIGCDDTGIFLKKAPIVTKMERKKRCTRTLLASRKFDCCISIHALPSSKPLPELRKSLSNSPSRANIIP